MAALPQFNFTLPALQLLRPAAAQKTAPAASAFRAAIDMIKGRRSSLVVMEGARGCHTDAMRMYGRAHMHARRADTKLAGILTERDFFMKLPLDSAGRSRSTLVSELMTPASCITTVPANHTVLQIVSTMRKHRARICPARGEFSPRELRSAGTRERLVARRCVTCRWWTTRR